MSLKKSEVQRVEKIAARVARFEAKIPGITDTVDALEKLKGEDTGLAEALTSLSEVSGDLSAEYAAGIKAGLGGDELYKLEQRADAIRFALQRLFKLEGEIKRQVQQVTKALYAFDSDGYEML